MNFILTTHAETQLAKRRLPLQLLQMVVEQPEQKFAEEGVQVYQSRFEFNGKTQLFRAFVNDSAEPLIVVSIYATSKINKYWR